jgi:predicted porin
MNKKLLAVAVVGALASPLAFAQTTTIYGGIDVGYQYAKSYAAGDNINKNFIQSGGDYTSRIGFKGSDDLAPGLTAVYVMEAGIAADQGTQDGPGFWQRQVYGGLDSKQWGALTFGRQYTHMFNQYGLGTWSVLTLAGTLNPAGFNTGSINPVRASNYAKYSSPKFGGFSVGVGYSPGVGKTAGSGYTNAQNGGEPTDTVAGDGRYWDGQVSWAQGPIGVAFSHFSLNNATVLGSQTLKRNQLTGKWDSGVFGVFAGYAKDSADADAGGGFATGVDIKYYWIQPVFRFGGNNELFGIWARNKDESTAASNGKTTYYGIEGRHYMTKRTWLYAGVAHAKNELEGAATGLATAKSPTTFAAAVTVNATSQNNPTGIHVGVATTF